METQGKTIKEIPELNEEPITKEEIDLLETQRLRLSGRPKGAKNKPKEAIELMDDPEGEDYSDIFDVCKNYIKEKGNDTVRIMIYRGGDMLTEARIYMGGKKDARFIYVNSWKELQDRFGGGRYHIKLISNNNGRVIKTQSQSLVDLTSEVNGADDFHSPFNPYIPQSSVPFPTLDNEIFTKQPESSTLLRPADQSTVVMQQLLMMLQKSTQQKSITQSLGEIIAVLTPIIPLVQSLLTRQKPLDAFEIQRMLDDKENIIRSRIIDERDKEEERIKRLVDEKIEYAGVSGGGEKSIVGELADLLKTVPEVLKPIMTQVRQPVPQRPQPVQAKALPQQVKAEIILPQVEEKPPVSVNKLTPEFSAVDQEPYNSLNDDEKYVFQTVLEAVTLNKDPSKVAKHIIASKEKGLFLKIDGDKLISAAKKMIQLDDAAWNFMDVWVKTFYKVLKSNAVVSNRGQKK